MMLHRGHVRSVSEAMLVRNKMHLITSKFRVTVYDTRHFMSFYGEMILNEF